MVTGSASSSLVRIQFERPAPDDVVEWRFDELERAGLDALDAIRVALDPTFDIAALRTLVARGCEAALAVRILR